MTEVLKRFEVLAGGLHTTIQDLGRYGYSSQGLSQGGPLDREAFEHCNQLLNNDINCACLEITLGGLKLKAESETYISLTGASCDLKINGKNQQGWQSIYTEINGFTARNL